jgi:hypothetical protein
VFWAGPKLISGNIKISKSVFCNTSIVNFPVCLPCPPCWTVRILSPDPIPRWIVYNPD